MLDPDIQVTRIAAYGLIVDDCRILLCRLSRQMPEHPGYWTLPGGGIEFGEDPAAAMVREVREETGLSVRPAGLADVDSVVVARGSRVAHGIRILYFAEVLGGSLAAEVDGSTDLCAWHGFEEVDALPAVPLVKAGLAACRRHQRHGAS